MAQLTPQQIQFKDDCEADMEYYSRPWIQATPFRAGRKMAEIDALLYDMSTIGANLWNVGELQGFWIQLVRMFLKEKPLIVYNDAQIQLAINMNYNYKKASGTSTTHPEARFARSVADRMVLLSALDLAEQLGVADINDYYGSTRLKDLWDSVTELPGRYWVPQGVQFIDFTWYRPVITSKDHIDYAPRLLSFPSSIPPGPFVAILTDIYADTAKICNELLKTAVVGAIMSSQIFMDRALVGVHFKDMVYFRDKDLIRQATSPMDHEWVGTHWNQDWLTKRSHTDGNHSLVWDTYRKYEDYHLLRMMRVLNVVHTPIHDPPPDPTIRIEIRRLKPKTFTQRLRNWWNKYTFSDTIFERDLFVYLPAVAKCTGSMAFKTRQVYQMSTLHKEVYDLISSDKLWEGLPPDTPYTKIKVVQDTVLWLFWSGFLDEISLTQGVANDTGVDWNQYKHLRNHLTPAQGMSAWIPTSLLGILCLILFLKFFPNRWLRMSLWAYIKNFKMNKLLEVLSPVMEEGVKKLLGFKGSLLIATTETALVVNSQLGKKGALMSKQLFEILGGFILKLGVHEMFRLSSHPVFFHSLWNSTVNFSLGDYTAGFSNFLVALSSPLSSGILRRWGNMNLGQLWEKQRFFRDYVRVRSHLTQYSGPLPLTYEEAKLPAVLSAPVYPDMPVQPDVAIQGGTENALYVLLGTTAMMYRPTGPAVFWHAYVQRNLIAVPITQTCEAVQSPCDFKTIDCPVGRQWHLVSYHMARQLRRRIKQFELEPLKSEEWIKHFGTAAKKQRARDGIEMRNAGTIRKRTGIFLKADEVLFGRDGVLKARTVKSLDPTIQALLYKPIELAMQKLKKVCNEKEVYKIRDWQVTLAVGSGRLASELDDWLRISFEWVSLGEKRVAAIMAGDDFFALVSEKSRVSYWENDFKSYDRTQGVHALKAERVLLETLGVSDSLCETLFSTILAPPRYQVARFDIKKKLPMPPQRATGGPDTTIGNTLVNQMSLWYTLLVDNTLDNLEQRQLELGLVAKLQKHEFLSSATFLKGWWLLTNNGFAWHPLPSQVIKVGKILTDPTEIFKHHTVDSAWRSAACSMGATYGLVPREYPLFGTLLARYDSFKGDVVDLPLEAISHKIVMDRVLQTDVSFAFEQIAMRYDLSYEEIHEMIQEVKNAPFPGLMVHRGWGVLAQRDYG